jgi:periplasmic protein TonB
MEDRVAEILGQRAALDHGFLAGVLVSLVLHGGITAAAVYAAMHSEAPKIASVLTIKFAPMRAPAVAAVAQPAAAPKPVTPRIEPPKPEPLKPVETKKAPEKNTVPLSPFGKSEKKGSEHPAAPPVTRQPGNPATQTAPATPGVSAALEGGDFPYTLYIDRMTTLVGSRFFRPQGASTPVTIYFAIDRDGTIRDARVDVPSGNSTVDRAALRAVLESSPLPPLPFGYSGTFLGVHLKFR